MLHIYEELTRYIIAKFEDFSLEQKGREAGSLLPLLSRQMEAVWDEIITVNISQITPDGSNLVKVQNGLSLSNGSEKLPQLVSNFEFDQSAIYEETTKEVTSNIGLPKHLEIGQLIESDGKRAIEAAKELSAYSGLTVKKY